MHGDLDRKSSRDEAIICTLELLRKRAGPVLIGELALSIGHSWTLEDTESLLEQLARAGQVRIVPGSLVRYEEVPRAV